MNAESKYHCDLTDQGVRRILADPAVCVTPDSSDFWFLVAALKDFLDNEGCGRLPLEVSKISSSVKASRPSAI